jgi:formate-dependent nitrite reductase membrane component NrfD
MFPWGIFIASYLFLGGAAGGSFLVGGYLDLKTKGEHKVSKFAGFTSFIAIVFGLGFLLMDLGQPGLAFNAFNQPFTSVMAFGTWIITFFTIVSAIYTSFFIRQFPWSRSSGGRKAFAVIGMILGLVTMYYTGLLVGMALTRPLWAQPLIPVLFTVSGASAGIAFVEIAPKVAARRNAELEEELKGLERTDALLIGLGSLIIISLAYVMNNSTATSSSAITTWLTGSLSTEFWGGLVAVGLILPALFYIVTITRGKGSAAGSAVLTVLAGFFVLVGGLILRYIVLGASTQETTTATLGFTSQSTQSFAGFFSGIEATFSPSATQLVYTTSMFVVLAVIYVAAAYFILRSKAGPQAGISISTPTIAAQTQSETKQAS